jgi:hypothetical protein
MAAARALTKLSPTHSPVSTTLFFNAVNPLLVLVHAAGNYVTNDHSTGITDTFCRFIGTWPGRGNSYCADRIIKPGILTIKISNHGTERFFKKLTWLYGRRRLIAERL